MEKEKVIRGLLDVNAFSRAVRLNPQTVYRKLWNKKLKGLRSNGHWLIPASQIATARKGE